MTWFSQEDAFLPGDLAEGLVGLVKALDILSRRVYQGCVCHVLHFQSCCIASVARLFGSGFHVILGKLVTQPGGKHSNFVVHLNMNGQV